MKIKFLSLFLIVFSISLFSKDREYETLMWEVKSATNTVYLMGSIHYATKDFYPLHRSIEDAFAKSDYLALEFDINKANPFEIMKYAFFQDTTTLRSKLDSATYIPLKAKLLELNIPESMILKMKPWFAIITAQITELKNVGFDAEMGIDKYFLGKAEKRKMKIFELESLQEQIDIFLELEKYADSFVKITLESIDDTVNTQNQIIEAYKNADADALAKLLNEGNDSEEGKKINELMNDNRNFKMLEKIKTYLIDNKNYFVVVGAAHLVGENGLVNLLQKTGKYKIKRF